MTTSPPRSRRPSDPGDPREAASAPGVLVAVKRIFGSESADYYVVIGATLFLVIFGLVMVLSSSSVVSLSASGDPFTGFLRQAMFALLGIPIMFVAARLPPVFWKKWAGLAILVALSLQFLVVATGLGVESLFSPLSSSRLHWSCGSASCWRDGSMFLIIGEISFVPSVWFRELPFSWFS